MNANLHSRLSAKRWGGEAADYYAIHDFIDSTKVLCSDNRHRILHTMWGIKQVVIPMFGSSLVNSEGRLVDVKDMCERDHLLVDFGNKFIPTLADFVRAIQEPKIPDWQKKLDHLHGEIIKDKVVSEILLSPLAVTGQLKALLITHNSWFINDILPKITNNQPLFMNFSITPDDFFNAMDFQCWMDNGLGVPASASRLLQQQVGA